MPIQRRKDTSRLVARKEVRGRGRKHYVLAYLWEDRESMRAAAGHGHSDDALAYHVPNSYSLRFESGWEDVRVEAPRLVGEVHFFRGGWDTEIIAHELCHALLHRLRFFGVVQELFFSPQTMEAEEAICREFGHWMTICRRWLWEIDPPTPEGG